MRWIPVILPNGSLNVYAVLDGRTATLEWLQDQVGGYIETMNIGKITIIMNEEGKLRELPKNISLGSTTIVGTIIICGTQDEDFADIPITFKEWKDMVDTFRGAESLARFWEAMG